MGEWSLQLNLVGLAPVNVFVPVPTGAYHARIDSAERVPGKSGKADNIVFGISLTDKEVLGASRNIYVSTNTQDDFIRRLWKTLMLSMGATPEMLEKPFSVSGVQFVGKACHVFLTAAAAEGEYDNLQWLTPDAFNRSREAMKAGLIGPKPASSQPAAASSQPAAASPQFTVQQPPALAQAANGIAGVAEQLKF